MTSIGATRGKAIVGMAAIVAEPAAAGVPTARAGGVRILTIGRIRAL